MGNYQPLFTNSSICNPQFYTNALRVQNKPIIPTKISSFLPPISLTACEIEEKLPPNDVLAAKLANVFMSKFMVRKLSQGSVTLLYFYDRFTQVLMSSSETLSYAQWRQISPDDLRKIITAVFIEVELKFGNVKVIDQVAQIVTDIAPCVYFDACDDWRYIALANGFLDCGTNKLLTANPEIFVSHHINIFVEELDQIFQTMCHSSNADNFDCYYPEIRLWRQYLESNSNGDRTLINRKKQILFKCLSGLPFNSLILLSGDTHTGKSTFVKLVKSYFDENLVAPFDIHDLTRRTDFQNFMGKVLAVDTDVANTPISEKAIAKLKKLKGRDSLCNVESRPGESPSVGQYNGNIILVGNGFFECAGQIDNSVMSALQNAPFFRNKENVSFDTNLTDKLVAIRSLIFADCYVEFSRYIRENKLQPDREFGFEGYFPLLSAFDGSPTQHELEGSFKGFAGDCIIRDDTCRISEEELLAAYFRYLAREYPDGTKPEVMNVHALGRKLRYMYPVTVLRRQTSATPGKHPIFLVGYRLREEGASADAM